MIETRVYYSEGLTELSLETLLETTEIKLNHFIEMGYEVVSVSTMPISVSDKFCAVAYIRRVNRSN